MGKVILVSIITATAASAATFFTLRALTGAPGLTREVQVPEVTGLRAEEARSLLEGRQLLLSISETVEDPRLEAGRVVRQSPLGGSSLRAGSEVRVVLSAGLPAISVPTVVGQPLATATALLTGAGLRVGAVVRRPDEKAPDGQIIASQPVAGQRLPRGSAVELTVSSGPDKVKVPKVLGRGRTEATRILTEAGLKVGRVTYDYDEDRRAGVVIRQSPQADDLAPRDSAVNLVLNEGD